WQRRPPWCQAPFRSTEAKWRPRSGNTAVVMFLPWCLPCFAGRNKCTTKRWVSMVNAGFATTRWVASVYGLERPPGREALHANVKARGVRRLAGQGGRHVIAATSAARAGVNTDVGHDLSPT